jgi:hypothetical protein
MKIQIIDHRNKLLPEVVALGKRHSKMLGLFPEGAFRDHARKRTIYAAVDGDSVLGYVLFRITSSKRIICITHLFVLPGSSSIF